jgi:hypothetical protein
MIRNPGTELKPGSEFKFSFIDWLALVIFSPYPLQQVCLRIPIFIDIKFK